VSDARLARWLAATRQVLALSPVEQLASLGELCAERAALLRSLSAEPPASAIPGELAHELEQAEAELGRALGELRTELGARIEALRSARHATSGYRPTTLGHPAFVSRTV
jgi:hypothetical protein